MKTVLLLLFLLGDLALAQDSAPAPVTPTEKERALAINQEIMDLAHGSVSSDARWQVIDGKIASYGKEFGSKPEAIHNLVLLRQAELWAAQKLGDQARYDSLVQQIAADPLPEVAALTAKLARLKTQPVDLKFTAIDGRTVDLANLRGKVVLIDFWATWCGPCVEEVPNVVAAYQKYHAGGLEVVGISLDQDKSALLSFTKNHGMAWPQYFDSQGWKNAISSDYGIHSIPAMWLIDKRGMLSTTDGVQDLDGKVSKLLSAP